MVIVTVLEGLAFAAVSAGLAAALGADSGLILLTYALCGSGAVFAMLVADWAKFELR